MQTMVKQIQELRKGFIIILMTPFLLFSQETKSPKPADKDINLESLTKLVEAQNNRIADLESQLNQITTVLLPEIKNTLQNLVQAKVQSDSIAITLVNRINTLQNKMKILEDKAVYADSTNFEILSQLVLLENKIVTLTRSFNEIYTTKSTPQQTSATKITSQDYQDLYVESLGHFQNGEYQKAIDGFSSLVVSDPNQSLADNSQYWLGECYYSMKNYKRAITEFEKVYQFKDSDKYDDAQLKLGLCYRNIGNEDRAQEEFHKLIELYPSSEYVPKAQRYLRK